MAFLIKQETYRKKSANEMVFFPVAIFSLASRAIALQRRMFSSLQRLLRQGQFLLLNRASLPIVRKILTTEMRRGEGKKKRRQEKGCGFSWHWCAP